MQVEVKFNYTETVIPQGCKIPRKVLFDDGMAAFNVNEVSENDAPVAIIDNINENGEMVTIVYRLYKNSLWTSHYSSQLPEAFFLEANCARNPIGYLSEGKSKSEIIEFINADLKDDIVISGVRHKKVNEPFYTIQSFGFGAGCTFAATLSFSDFREFRKENVFSLKQKDKVIEELKKCNEKVNLPLTDLTLAHNFSILIDKAITINK